MPPKNRADEWHFRRSALARDYIETLEQGCIRRLAICATPSTGKTSFLLNDVIPEARRREHLVAYANLREDASTPAQIMLSAVKSCIEDANAESHKIRSLCAKIAKYLEFDSVTIDAHIADIEFKHKKKTDSQTEDPIKLLRAAVKTITEEFPDRRLLLILDDTQHLAKDPNGGHHAFTSGVAHVLDQAGGQVLAMFSISSAHVMDRHFAEAGKELFVRAEITDLPKLDRDFIEFLNRRCEAKARLSFDPDAAWSVFKEIDYAPMVFRSLVARFMREKGGRTLSEIYAEYTDQHPSHRTHRHLWDEMPHLQREVFLCVAAGQNPRLSHVIDGIRKHLGPTSRDDILSALTCLEQSGHIEPQTDPLIPYCVVSSTFAQWCKGARREDDLQLGQASRTTTSLAPAC